MTTCTPKRAGNYLMACIDKLPDHPGPHPTTIDSANDEQNQLWLNRLEQMELLLIAMHKLFEDDDLDSLRRRTWGYLRYNLLEGNEHITHNTNKAIRWFRDSFNLISSLQPWPTPGHRLVHFYQRDENDELTVDRPSLPTDSPADLEWTIGDINSLLGFAGWFTTIRDGWHQE